MKNLIIALVVVLLTACGSDHKTPGAPGNNTDSVTPQTTIRQPARPTSSDLRQAVAKNEDSKAGTGDPGSIEGKAGDKDQTQGTPDAPAVQSADASQKQQGEVPLNQQANAPKTTNPATSNAGSNANVNTISLSSSADNTVTGNYEDNGNAIIYVGVFAKWNSDGSQFDGSYDSTHSLFVLCGSNHCQHVPASEIAYQVFGSCDTAKGDRLKMFKINKNGSINPDGVKISVEGSRGFIKEGPNTRVIQLDPGTIKRIDKANTRKATMQPAPPVKKQEVQMVKPADVLITDNTKAPAMQAVPPVKKQEVEVVKPADVLITDNTKAPVEKGATNPKPPADTRTQLQNPVQAPVKVTTVDRPKSTPIVQIQQPGIQKASVDTTKKVIQMKASPQFKSITPKK